MSAADRVLAGRTILLTGASSGLGAHFAPLLANAGAKVVIGARRVEPLQSLVKAIADAGGEALAVALDVTNEASVIAAFDAGEARFGPVTSVVANAGIVREGRAINLDVADFDAVFATNVRGTFLTAREAARRMLDNGLAKQGRIVLISSITAHMCTSGTATYSASKAAVTHLGRVLAREWIRSGPNVNILSPGYIATDLTGDWFESDAGKKQMATWPRARLLESDALDSSLIYLLSDQSIGITGSDFVIDDGQSL